ncbi:MAG: hypothetical protein JNK58_03690 [Phycisphaerae bacterium]|nr:hypothetical protein [Phycisphaerae bacterium]
MTLNIRLALSVMLAAFLLAVFSPAAHAQGNPAKIDKTIDKTIVKFEKTVQSYEKKVNQLVAKCTTKVGKMVEKGQSAEQINTYINKTIMTGMGFASTTRAKIDATERSGLRSLEKYDSSDEDDAEISSAADDCHQQIDDIWTAAGTALHALEVH